MKYQDIRDHISNGDFFLFRGNRWWSRLIRWRTQSVFSHVGVALWVHVGGLSPRLAILEALEPHGVRLFPFSRYLEECSRQGVGVDWYKLDRSSVNGQMVAAYALEQWGKPYAMRQLVFSFGLVGGLVRRLLHLHVPVIDGEGEEKFFCSELAAAAVEAGGYKPDSLDESLPAAIDPGSVALFPCLHRMGTLSM
jgi:hypothetical protein